MIYSPLFKKNGVINTDLMHISDLLPTFYAAAGAVFFFFVSETKAFFVFRR